MVAVSGPFIDASRTKSAKQCIWVVEVMKVFRHVTTPLKCSARIAFFRAHREGSSQISNAPLIASEFASKRTLTDPVGANGGCSKGIESDLVRTTASFGRFKGRLSLSIQCFHDSDPVALVTEKVRPPRNEIISPPSHHVGIGGSTIGTLRLRVSFHFPCSFFSAE